ncbi:hypothetical protein ABZP36_028727 [Zizania latifolia]
MADYGNAMMRGHDSGVQSRTKVHNRANQLQLKLIGQSHPTGLTANLLKLFEPRPPLEYKPPVEKRKLPAYTGMAQFVSQFVEPGDPEYAPPVPKGETRAEKKARIRQLKLEQGAAKVTEELQKYDPQTDPNATGDPYKTLFVARLNYEMSEHRIKREFEAYGPIKRVRLVTDKITNKPRGYVFIEYMHTRDMKNAYKQADGRKVDSKRILVDVERGRTVPNWRPRRLGGGLGSSRITGEDAVQKQSTREQQYAGRLRSEEPRRDDRHSDRDREKSRERIRERSRDERTCERSHDDSREERHHHKNRERTRDRDQEKDKERDRGHDRRDRDKHRDHSRDYEREREHGRSHDRHRDRGRDRDKDYERSSYERDRGHLRERDADYSNGEPKHDRNLVDYGQDYSYKHYEQHKSHETYGYCQDGRGHETVHIKQHEMATNYQSRPDNLEPEGPEEGEAYEEDDYQYPRADDYKN